MKNQQLEFVPELRVKTYSAVTKDKIKTFYNSLVKHKYKIDSVVLDYIIANYVYRNESNGTAFHPISPKHTLSGAEETILFLLVNDFGDAPRWGSADGTKEYVFVGTMPVDNAGWKTVFMVDNQRDVKRVMIDGWLFNLVGTAADGFKKGTRYSMGEQIGTSMHWHCKQPLSPGHYYYEQVQHVLGQINSDVLTKDPGPGFTVNMGSLQCKN